LAAFKKFKKKEINASKIYSPDGKLAEQAKLADAWVLGRVNSGVCDSVSDFGCPCSNRKMT